VLAWVEDGRDSEDNEQEGECVVVSQALEGPETH
jgi:hypothetical protein